MNLAAFSFSAFGVACAALGVAHEFTWWKRRHGKVVTGIVFGTVEDFSCESKGYFPEVEYVLDGEVRRFVSKYGGMEPKANGTAVDVLVSATGTNAEVLTPCNRLLFTVLPIIFGLLFFLTGLGIKQ